MSFTTGPVRYPIRYFHQSTREAIEEVSDHIQSPEAIIAMAFLAVMSASCQGLIDVRLPTGQLRPVSLNLFGIADSGERKSATDEIVAKPLHQHLAKRQRSHIEAMERYEHELALWEDVRQVLQQKRAVLIRKNVSTDALTLELASHRKFKPVSPRMRHLVRRDLTGRAFVDALHGDGEALALLSAEGDVILKSEAMRHLAFLNTAWDGATISLDRADGNSAIATNPRVTVSIVAQSSAFQQYMQKQGEQARGTGMLARFLVGWPASNQGWRQLRAEEPTWRSLSKFHLRVEALLEEYDRHLREPAVVRNEIGFTLEAKNRWIELVNEVEHMMIPGGRLKEISDFASKAPEIVGRVAALFHYFSGEGGSITLDTLERAIGIVAWHVDEFQRIFEVRSDVAIEHADAERLMQHLHKNVWQRGFAVTRRNDLLWKGPVALRTKRRLDPALDLLVRDQVVWFTEDRSRRRYVNLNPQAFNYFAGGAV